MKGQPDLLVERAVLQARREADLLYNLVVGANVAVIENKLQREREYPLLLGYLSAEMRGKAPKVQTLLVTGLALPLTRRSRPPHDPARQKRNRLC
jgi:hypothetical protein